MNAQRSIFQDQPVTMDEIISAWTGNANKWLSRKQICDALGRAKSPQMIAMLGIMLGMGYLETRTVRLPNQVDMYEYIPTNKWFNTTNYPF